MLETMDIRKIVSAELERQGRSVYWLAKAVEKHMSNTTVYEFVKGEKQVTAANLGYVLDALGIKLTPGADPGASTRKPARN